MNLNELRNKLKPTLKPFEVEGFTVYVQRPAGRDIDKCNDQFNTIVCCVRDENGDEIFSTEDVEGRINIKSIDFVFIGKLFKAVTDLLESGDSTESVEKK